MDNNYIKIYEIENYNFEPNVWLIDILEDKKIPYKKKIEEYWVGNVVSEYKMKLNIFIPEKYKDEVQEYINQYHNIKPRPYIPQNILKEDKSDLKTMGIITGIMIGSLLLLRVILSICQMLGLL